MNQSELATFIEQLRSSDAAVAKAAVRSLGQLGDRRAVEPIIELLRSADDTTVRNAAAVALRDLGDSRAVLPLLEQLKDPRTAGARGTLVWALSAFDCAPHIELLIELVIHDGYEAAREAAEAVVSIDGAIDPAVWQRCIAELKAALPSASSERAPVLDQLLARFEDRG